VMSRDIVDTCLGTSLHVQGGYSPGSPGSDRA